MEERLHCKRRFGFEKFWTNLDGFLDVVKEAWVCDGDITDPFHRLDVLLRNTARALDAWGRKKWETLSSRLQLQTL